MMIRFRGDLLVLIPVLLIVGVFAGWWTHGDVNSFTLQTHGDQVWIQASAQVAMQTGPFATNTHVGWFSGFNPWAYPGLGSLGFYTLAWIGGLFTASSSQVLVGIMAITAVVVAAASYLAIRLVPVGRVEPWIAGLGALALGLSPYVLSKMGHYSVGAWYVLAAGIAAAGALSRWRSTRARIVVLAVFALAVMASSLWWIAVTLFALLLVLLLSAVLRRWAWVRGAGVMFTAALVGAAFPVWLASVNTVPGGTTNRTPWESTYFGGSLTDLLLASPWLADMLPGLAQVAPGASRELSAVGLIPAIFAALAVVIALTAYLGLNRRWIGRTGWLLIVLQVTLLSFLTLGLGTLQEALLILIGFESPLRGWSRLIIVLALLGMVLAAPAVSAWWRTIRSSAVRLGVALASSVVVLAVTVLDARSIELMEPRTLPSIEEAAAVSYLSETIGDCPVAQLPIGTFPDFPMGDGSPESITHFYRGFVPYLLNPDGRWSFGAAKGTRSDDVLRGLPEEVGLQELTVLSDAGYCAILFDTEYARYLESRSVLWPGSRMAGDSPAMDAGRFRVYLTPLAVSALR